MKTKKYTLWRLKDKYRSSFCGFDWEDINLELNSRFELDREFNNLEIGGCGLSGVYVVTRKDRLTPILVFKTKEVSNDK